MKFFAVSQSPVEKDIRADSGKSKPSVLSGCKAKMTAPDPVPTIIDCPTPARSPVPISDPGLLPGSDECQPITLLRLAGRHLLSKTEI